MKQRNGFSKEESRRHPQLDLYGEEREACNRKREEFRPVLSNVSNILLNGCDVILNRTFDRIEFNRMDGEVKVAINCFISHVNVSRLLHVSASWL